MTFKFYDSHTHSLKNTSSTVYEFICYPSIDNSQSLAIHPWELSRINSIEINDIISKLKKHDYIGECGLDRSIPYPIEKQIQIFKKHLDYSHDKLTIIHCVKAISDLLNIRAKYTNNWFIHGYNGNFISIQQFLKKNKNTWFGFGSLLFSSNNLSQTLLKCPIEHILLETDEQDKYSIESIYFKVSKIKKIPLESLQQMIKINFHNCFKGLKCQTG